MAAEKVRMFGLTPKVALLSHSSFGSYQDKSARKMKKTLKILRQRAPELEVDGEMTGEMALNEEYRKRLFPSSSLTGQANLMVAPDLNSAHIAFGLAKIIGNAVGVGPLLLGAGRPAHVMTPAATSRRIMNMTAIAVVDAQIYARSRLQKPVSTGGAG
jgi:malate dehydrogenase (oxaloacetate-decarboxylating)(NADP+)